MSSVSKNKRQKLSEPQCKEENVLSLNYEELDNLGTGAYGRVYRARDNHTGKLVAIKQVHIPLTDNGVSASTLREIALLKQINAYAHGNIVKLLEINQCLERDGELLILLVFEHFERDLSDLIKDLPKTGIKPSTLQRLSHEMLTGVSILHAHNIIHSDLKPQNLLLSSHGRLKIADFGLTNTCDSEKKLTSRVVTPWYRAPEILLTQINNSAMDIWSIACIIYEMFNRKPLFPGTCETNQLDRIFELTGRPTDEQWPSSTSILREHFPERQAKRLSDFNPDLCEFADDLLNKMLSYDIKRRPTAQECLQHDYFQQELLSH